MSVLTDLKQLRGEVGELLEQHDSEQSVLDLSQYVGRPVEFAREVLGFDAYDKQAELIESAFSNKFTVARGNHSAGKDASLAPVALYSAYVLNQLVLIVSATEKQLLGQVWTEIRRRFAGSKLPGRLYAAGLDIGGERRIHTMTSGNTSNLTGWHDKNGVCMLVSESQAEQVESAAFDAILANVTDNRSRCVVVGNPIKPIGRYFEIHQKPAWKQVHFSAFDHPNVKEDREVIPGGPTLEWIAEVAAEYGADSAYYQGRVLGEFPTTGSFDALVSRADIDRAFELHRTGALLVAANAHSTRLVADIARGGSDSSCVAHVKGPVVLSLEAFREPDLMKTASKLHTRALEVGLSSWGVRNPTWKERQAASAHITIDDNGVGGGVTDRLRELGARVGAFNGSHKPLNALRFANERAESYFGLREKLMRGKIALPPDEVLAEELLNTCYTTNSADKIIIEPKEDIRAKIGRSPDRADTVSMASKAPRVMTVGTLRI